MFPPGDLCGRGNWEAADTKTLEGLLCLGGVGGVGGEWNVDKVFLEELTSKRRARRSWAEQVGPDGAPRACAEAPGGGHIKGIRRGQDGGAGRTQGCGRASQGKFPVQTCGPEGASEGVQAEAWHGPVGFGKVRGCTEEKYWACGKRVGDGWPWAQPLECELGRSVVSSNHQELLKDGTREVEGSVQQEAWEFDS